MPVLRELRFTSRADIDLLKRFYDDCYLPEFPDPDERDSLESVTDHLRRKDADWYEKNNYHVVVALDGDKPVGGSISDYLVEPNAGVIEYLLIKPDHRGTGLGRQLLEMTEGLLREDAQEGHGRPLDWIVGEMDDPYRTRRPPSGFDPFARARVWHNLGYRMLDFPYVQPALSIDQSPVNTLLLMAKTCTPRFTDSVPSTEVRTIVHEYLVWAMRIAVPENNKEFQAMSTFLQHRSSVKLIPFSDYLGWEKEAHLQLHEVLNESDPELEHTVRVYDEVFTDPDTAISSGKFREAFQPDGLSDRPGYRYHLWTIRRDAGGECVGMASFLTMPSAGFGGYLGLLAPFRGSGQLHHLAARIEERMLRDGTDAVGWYIECAGETARNIFLKLGFRELDVTYRQPSLPGGNVDSPGTALHLLYKPFGRVYAKPDATTTIEKSAFLQAVREIYQAIYDIPKPDDDKTFMTLEESLERVAAVRTKPHQPTD